LEKIMRNNENTPTRSWKGVTRRLIVAGTSALMVASLMTPSAAFAAESISVEGTSYDWQEGGYSGTGSNGGTWSWDTAENLTLNNYNGGGIEAFGDLNVSYSGTNTITDSGNSFYTEANETETEEGNLTLTANGDATLNLTASDPIYTPDGSVDIEGGTVNIESTGGYGIDSGNDITINDATVNVKSSNSDERSGYYSDAEAVGAEGDVTINNSKLKVEATARDEAIGIASYDNNETYGGIVINNSTIDVVASSVKGSAVGIYSHVDTKDPSGIAIKDSTVNVSATGVDYSAGICVKNHDGEAYLNVNNSDVTAKADATSDEADLQAAVYVLSNYGSSITVNGAEIKTPESGEAYTFDDKDGAKVVSIGAKGASGKDDMASEVVISTTKDDETEPEAEVTPASYTKGGEKKLAQTGDASAAGMFAAAAAGISALGAGAFLSRRRG
jgi:LPXTG-motif cell wall-anchored protein